MQKCVAYERVGHAAVSRLDKGRHALDGALDHLRGSLSEELQALADMPDPSSYLGGLHPEQHVRRATAYLEYNVGLIRELGPQATSLIEQEEQVLEQK